MTIESIGIKAAIEQLLRRRADEGVAFEAFADARTALESAKQAVIDAEAELQPLIKDDQAIVHDGLVFIEAENYRVQVLKVQS